MFFQYDDNLLNCFVFVFGFFWSISFRSAQIIYTTSKKNLPRVISLHSFSCPLPLHGKAKKNLLPSSHFLQTPPVLFVFVSSLFIYFDFFFQFPSGGGGPGVGPSVGVCLFVCYQSGLQASASTSRLGASGIHTSPWQATYHIIS